MHLNLRLIYNLLLHQICSQWKGGCQEAILKEGKQEKRLTKKNWAENQWQQAL